MSGIDLFLLIVIGSAAVLALLSLIFNKFYTRVTGSSILLNGPIGVGCSAAAVLLSFLALIDPVEEDIAKLGGPAAVFALVALAAVIELIVMYVRAWWRSGADKRREQYWKRIYRELAVR